eukprot:767469-Pelagomonas_calceolata.AAC.1
MAGMNKQHLHLHVVQKEVVSLLQPCLEVAAKDFLEFVALDGKERAVAAKGRSCSCEGQNGVGCSWDYRKGKSCSSKGAIDD